MVFARTNLLVQLSALLVLPLGGIRAEKEFTTEQRSHWAFQKMGSPVPPSDAKLAWGNDGIDSFVLKSLEQNHLIPSAAADKSTLLRRATFDLTRLPPTPEEVGAFVKDKSSSAFEAVIDRLLLSPHYGERWARHWLDLARYAESEGFKADE